MSGTDGANSDAIDVGPWRYVWRDVPRPFVHPVRTPAEHVISRDAPEDHWWHHALWFTIKFVDGENFWEEYDEFGLLHQAEPPAVEAIGDTIVATSSIEWQRPEGRGVALDQTTTLVHRPLDGGAHALDWDVVLVARDLVELDRTPFTTWGGYGGLTFRGRGDWHDTRLRLPDGEPRERVLGDRAEWLALDGPLPVDGGTDTTVGLVLFDHPSNPTAPTPWYASTRAETYGTEGWSNFANAAFLWDGPLSFDAGEPCRLRHRVLVHDGELGLDAIEVHRERWLADAPR